MKTMKLHCKTLGKLALTLVALAAITTSALALSGMQTTTITLDSSKTTDVLLGYDTIHKEEPVSTMIGSDVVAAVNGGFFNSYSSGNGGTFPDDCPRIYGAIVDEGMIINGGDTNNMIGFSYDNTPMIGRVQITPAYVINNTASFNVWSINQVSSSASGMYILNDLFDYSYTVPSTSSILVVSNDKITSILSGGTYTVADGTLHVVINVDAAANLKKWNNFPVVGDTLELTLAYDDAAWSDTKTAITGGRMLVIDGKNVTADTSYNSEYDSDEKQSNTSSMMRSFAAIMGDGSVVFGTANGTFPDLANQLISMGATDAISLDGGASSMLYSQSSGYITPAGRSLASVLTVSTDLSTASTRPDLPDVVPSTTGTTVLQDPNAPDTWAQDAVDTCESMNLVPSWMSYGYKNNITRSEFCKILAQFIQTTTGKSLEDVIKEAGNNYADYTFTDTDDYHVRCIAAMGIVNGTDGGAFSPSDLLTREQAATMILRMVNLLGSAPQVASPTFADQAQISDWAVSGVAEITGAQIMNGDGTNFNPADNYTKQEAYITVLNVYNKWTLN